MIGWDDGIYKLTEKGLKISRILEELSRSLRSPAFNVKNIEKIPHRCFAPVIEKYCGILGKLLGDRLVSVMLFGSVARGEWDRDSDIDILVIVEGWNSAPVWERVKELRRERARGEFRVSGCFEGWLLADNPELSAKRGGG